MALHLFLFGSLLVLPLVLAIETGPTCIVDDIPAQHDFSLTRYMGQWYEISLIVPFYISDPYTDLTNVYEEVNSTHLVAHIIGRSYEGCFLKNEYFKIVEEGQFLKENSGDPFWVLKTDYDNYSATYGCDEKFENGTCKSVRGWIWSRTKTISQEHYKQAKMALESACISKPNLLKTDQTNDCKSSSLSGSAFGLSSYSLKIMLVLLLFPKNIF